MTRLVLTAVVAVVACGGRHLTPASDGGAASGGSGGGAGGVVGTTGAGGSAGAGGGPDCQTSISGVVRDPAGNVPLYDVLVYVPAQAPDPMTDGIACLQCGPYPARPLAAALTDPTGAFKMPDVPPGTNVPVVIEIGKWRRQVTIPSVIACQDNPLPATLTRQPRNQTEGHLPRIAVVTGHAGAYECLLRAMGIDDGELTTDTGAGRVHLYAGGAGAAPYQGATSLASGAALADAYATLFASPSKLAAYDFVLLACEGGELDTFKQPYTANLKAYADGGGRLFLEHLQSFWMRGGPDPWPATATWRGSGGPDLATPITGIVDVSFPKGLALADWLVAAGASATHGQIPVVQAQHSIDPPVAAGTQTWMTTASPMPSIQYLTFGTPVEAEPAYRCGRVDFADTHVTAGAGTSSPTLPFPQGCTAAALTAQEQLWEFLFFDLPLCVQPGRVSPPPPP